MKKQFFLSCIIALAFTNTVLTMQDETSEHKLFSEFQVETYKLTSDIREEESKINTKLSLQKPNLELPRMSVFNFIEEAFAKEPEAVYIGSHDYNEAFMHILKLTMVTTQGDLDFYGTMHALNANREKLEKIFPLRAPVQPFPTPHTKDAFVSTIFSWIKPTLKYGSVILGTYGLVRLWDFYRTR